MTPRSDLVIVGAGGHAREVREIVETRPESYRLLGFVDDAADGHSSPALGYPLLGDTRVLEGMPVSVVYLIGIGNGTVRRRLDERLRASGRSSATLIHRDATTGGRVDLAPGVILFAGARLTTDITVGRHSHVNQNATIGHDARIGDYVTLNPNCAVSGNTSIGDEVMMGAGSSVIQGLSIGLRSTVGAGATVVRDLPSDVTAVGVPARPLQR